ncbi:substrate-binding periplasmic protein [Vibrio atypicus]|uniref:substrate-binding periplasmic protein n=1 Tax=Vibrio atypicus TaxID=558271 RepID=UPI0013573602|nr:ABC transporter substrate-binding protein [Vibrio atypicus]
MKWLLLLFMMLGSANASQRIYMTSLDWPPYSGKDLPEYGTSVSIAKAAFAAMGYELVVDFKPWVRTVASASKQDKYIGYFPEYWFDSEQFVFSDSIGSGPLGLVQNQKKPIEWTNLDDLKKYRIGVVQGYVNTEQFDALVLNGTLTVEASVSDSRNVNKVAKSRLDAAVIDVNVLKYLIDADSRSQVLKERLEMNSRLLEEKQLYLAFKNTPEGKNWRDIFNQGLKLIQRDEAMINSTQESEGKPHTTEALNLE